MQDINCHDGKCVRQSVCECLDILINTINQAQHMMET